MDNYRIAQDISFVSDHGKLVVLNFESGEYFVVEGVCMTILQLIEHEQLNKDELMKALITEYNADEYDVPQSLDFAIKSLVEYGFVVEVK